MALDESLVERIIRLSPEKRAQLEQRMTSPAPSEASPASRGNVDRAPTSFAQRSQWFVNQLDPENPFFNKTDAVRIRGPIDIDALQRAVSALVARHAVLRTGYRDSESGPVQVIHPPGVVEVPIIEIPAGPRQSADLLRHLASEQRRPFDLENGPMYRVHLIRLGEDDHVLARTNHHIAFDRWSSGIANAELSALYASFASGGEPALPPLPYQYSDYAVWQRDHLDEAAIARHLEFAEAHIAGVPQILDLPTDHPRPLTQSHRGASYHTSLRPDLVRKVRETARAEGATPFMACLAGFAALIGRYARTDQFLLGVPAAGRTAPGSDALIGLFINSMVMRLDLRGDPSFSGLVSRVRASTLAAMSHQDLPFETLVENLARDRAPGRTPVFQVMFDYVNTPGAGLTLGGLDLEPISIADEASVYDINLYLYDDGAEIRAKWEYRSDLFDRPSIVRMSQAYETLLEAAVTEPTRVVTELPLVSSEDLRRIHDLGDGPTAEIPEPGSFLSRIRDHASTRGDSPAVVTGHEAISYRELWNRISGVSSQIETSCPRDAMIAVLTGRTAELVPGLLGVLHSGRTAVMVDTSQPSHRTASMLDQLPLGAAVTTAGESGGSLASELPNIGVAPGADSAPVTASPDDPTDTPGYVVFTSGSTGTPRPVAVGRIALENFVEDVGRRYELGADDVVLQFASPGFDTLFEEVAPTLAAGATLVMRPAELFSSFAEFGGFIEDHAITVLDLPTAWWHAWVDEMERSATTSVPECVRLVIIGGEAASTARWRVWQRITGGRIRLVNTYGPSETTVVVSTFEPPREWAPTTDAMPIGRPIRNARLRVVDVHGGELPPGVPGELVIEGAPVGDGYLGGDRDGFRDHDGERRYHTGDLARLSIDGVFDYLGRIDDQLKISGIRIEPGEIEAALKTHEAVEDAVVLGTAADGGTQISGHVLASTPIPLEVLRGHLLERLPPVMLPASLSVHDAFPVTASGKIDRAALRALTPTQEESREDRSSDRPPTITEKRLTAVWDAVLPRASMSLDDDFFSVGGHSLLGVRLISHAADEFGVKLPLRVIYEAPTIATMAAWIDRLLEPVPTNGQSWMEGGVLQTSSAGSEHGERS